MNLRENFGHPNICTRWNDYVGWNGCYYGFTPSGIDRFCPPVNQSPFNIILNGGNTFRVEAAACVTDLDGDVGCGVYDGPAFQV